MGRRPEVSFREKKGKVRRTCSCVHRSWVEVFHLYCGSRLSGLHWNIYSAARKVPWRQRPQVGKGTERVGRGGRARELLALTSEKGQGVGKRRILKPRSHYKRYSATKRHGPIHFNGELAISGVGDWMGRVQRRDKVQNPLCK